MRVAISNIAWEVCEDTVVAELLRRVDIDAIDIAPGKYFSEPLQVADKSIKQIQQWWKNQGIEIIGMQALLFGTTGFNIFGSPAVQIEMLNYLAAICRIGRSLGAVRLVFGSPKNRDKTGLTDQETRDIAFSFFNRLGDIAKSWEVMICLEPNPVCYGANFMINTAETASIVEGINHSAIKMQLDTGALTLNNECAATVLKNFSHLIGHIHASEPNLVPLGEGGVDHKSVYANLLQYLPHHIVTVEMKATSNEPPVVSIARALQTAISCYSPERQMRE